jgi:hypothetical protein
LIQQIFQPLKKRKWVVNLSPLQLQQKADDPWTSANADFVNTISSSNLWDAADIDSFEAMMETPASDEKYDADISMSEGIFDNSFISTTTAPSPSPAMRSSILVGTKTAIALDAIQQT